MLSAAEQTLSFLEGEVGAIRGVIASAGGQFAEGMLVDASKRAASLSASVGKLQVCGQSTQQRLILTLEPPPYPEHGAAARRPALNARPKPKPAASPPTPTLLWQVAMDEISLGELDEADVPAARTRRKAVNAKLEAELLPAARALPSEESAASPAFALRVVAVSLTVPCARGRACTAYAFRFAGGPHGHGTRTAARRSRRYLPLDRRESREAPDRTARGPRPARAPQGSTRPDPVSGVGSGRRRRRIGDTVTVHSTVPPARHSPVPVSAPLGAGLGIRPRPALSVSAPPASPHPVRSSVLRRARVSGELRRRVRASRYVRRVRNAPRGFIMPTSCAARCYPWVRVRLYTRVGR
eukprot:149328-Prymnesium_polylepis.1